MEEIKCGQSEEKERELELLRARLLLAEQDVARLGDALSGANSELERINAELVAVYASKRWKLTEPLSRVKQRVNASPAPAVTPTKEHGLRLPDAKNILVLDHTVPMPDQDAGSRALVGYMRVLGDMGYNIYFMAEDFAAPQPYADQLQEQGVTVLSGGFYEANWKTWLNENAERLYVAVVSRANVARRFLKGIRENTRAKILFMPQDLHFLRARRERELGGNVGEQEVRTARAMEIIAMNDADETLLYSDVEAEIAEREFGVRVHVVPLFFYEEIPPRKIGFGQTKDLLFVGGFRHQPNVDAMQWFVADVLPRIRESLPDVRLHIVGAHPTDAVLALANDTVNVAGFVTDEQLERYYQTCRVCVTPLRFGAGIKGKTLEAMQFGLPVVSTSIGTEGMPGIESIIPIANDAAEFARQVVRLYQNEEDWQTASVAEQQYLMERYSYRSVKNLLERILNEPK